MNTAVVILAAGKGTRMKSATPKVLHKVANRPMLGHVIQAGLALNPEKTVIIYSHDEVKTYAETHFKNVVCVKQEEQLGTAHAVLAAEEALKGFTGDVAILCGDVPLINANLMARFHASHHAQNNDVTFISAFADDPTGLGRVVRDDNEDVQAIVEHKDATDEQKQIDEINAGLYMAKSDTLFKLLHQVESGNAQQEFYITDIVSLGLKDGYMVGTFTAEDADALGGVNSREQLAFMEDMYQNRLRERFMSEGVTFIDPQSVFFSYDTTLGQDVEIGPNVRFGEGVIVQNNVTFEGNLYIKNSNVEEDVQIESFNRICNQTISFNSYIESMLKIKESN